MTQAEIQSTALDIPFPQTVERKLSLLHWAAQSAASRDLVAHMEQQSADEVMMRRHTRIPWTVEHECTELTADNPVPDELKH